MSNAIIIEDAVKKYGDFTAVKNVSLHIKSGEFFTLLGSSGCGKTTLLRMIAGFNTIDNGVIKFGDKVINNVEAHKRDIGMVFQNYAIFPHLTVFENVAYGLKARKVERSKIKDRVLNALQLVQIEDLKDRKPNELSGGQQQRVALARAVVIEPALLLMDEPLSNLDAKLRVQMRTIIKKLQMQLGITTIYVTHDQEEALAISDRIAVMNAGSIMQVGAPYDIYMKPENPFVSNFIGISNMIDCEVMGENPEKAEIITSSGYTFTMKLSKKFSGKAIIAARPEQCNFASEGIEGEIVLSTFLGDFVDYEVTLSDGKVIQINEYMKNSNRVLQKGEKVKINFETDKISVYEKDSGGLL